MNQIEVKTTAKFNSVTLEARYYVLAFQKLTGSLDYDIYSIRGCIV